MTKEEFWNKWTKQAFGSHIPVRLIKQKEEFLKDLELVIQEDIETQIDTSGTFIWSSSPAVPGSMLGLGHEWVFPHPDNFETAYCVCDRCGVSSEDKEAETTCIGGITNE